MSSGFRNEPEDAHVPWLILITLLAVAAGCGGGWRAYTSSFDIDVVTRVLRTIVTAVACGVAALFLGVWILNKVTRPSKGKNKRRNRTRRHP